MQWKTENRRFLMDVVRVIYQDERHQPAEDAGRCAHSNFALVHRHHRQGIDQRLHRALPCQTRHRLQHDARDVGDPDGRAAGQAYEGDIAVAFDRIILSHEYAIARMLGYDGELNLIDIKSAKLWAEVAESTSPGVVPS